MIDAVYAFTATHHLDNTGSIIPHSQDQHQDDDHHFHLHHLLHLPTPFIRRPSLTSSESSLSTPHPETELTAPTVLDIHRDATAAPVDGRVMQGSQRQHWDPYAISPMELLIALAF